MDTIYLGTIMAKMHLKLLAPMALITAMTASASAEAATILGEYQFSGYFELRGTGPGHVEPSGTLSSATIRSRTPSR